MYEASQKDYLSNTIKKVEMHIILLSHKHLQQLLFLVMDLFLHGGSFNNLYLLHLIWMFSSAAISPIAYVESSELFLLYTNIFEVYIRTFNINCRIFRCIITFRFVILFMNSILATSLYKKKIINAKYKYYINS